MGYNRSGNRLRQRLKRRRREEERLVKKAQASQTAEAPKAAK